MIPVPSQSATSSCILYTYVLGSHRSNTSIIIVLASFISMPLSVCFIRVNVFAPPSLYFTATVTCVSSCSFIYLCVPCQLLRFTLKSSALRVRVKTLRSVIHAAVLSSKFSKALKCLYKRWYFSDCWQIFSFILTIVH